MVFRGDAGPGPVQIPAGSNILRLVRTTPVIRTGSPGTEKAKRFPNVFTSPGRFPVQCTGIISRQS